VRSEVNLAIWRLLNRLGVEIPFPQRVVQMLPAAEPPPRADPGVAAMKNPAEAGFAVRGRGPIRPR
jgi:small-conductance mechanosensitive channel